MNYVDHFNLFGIDAKQIPCDTGEGAPTTATVGAVGCFYMDTLTGDVYKCVNASGGEYGWELFGSGSPDTVKYTAQTLTEEQKAQARENIGAANEDYVDDKVASEKTNLQSEIEVERARIDAFPKELILTLFRNATYASDNMLSTIDALEKAFGMKKEKPILLTLGSLSVNNGIEKPMAYNTGMNNRATLNTLLYEMTPAKVYRLSFGDLDTSKFKWGMQVFSADTIPTLVEGLFDIVLSDFGMVRTQDSGWLTDTSYEFSMPDSAYAFVGLNFALRNDGPMADYIAEIENNVTIVEV